MARQPRFVLPNQPHHIIQRGNNRQVIFCATTDHQHFLEKLLSASQKHECKIHAYVLMSNHVHLLVTPSVQAAAIIKTIQSYSYALMTIV